MSIDTQITALEEAGKLYRFVPKAREPSKRRAFLTQQALDDLTNPESPTNLFGLRGYIQNALTRWTKGERVHADKRKPGFLKRLEPPPEEIWEVKVTEPDVQARLFGRFAAPNTIVFTNFYTRRLLGRKGSSMWIAAMETCKESWETIFPENEPFRGTSIHDYVLEKCDDFDI